MSDVEVDGRELVIKKDGRVRRSPVPDDFSPTAFRHVVAAVDMLYRRNGRLPTIDEVTKEWEGFTRKTVQKAFAAPELREALSIRGIEMSFKAGLTPEQLYAITILQDFTDRRSTKTKLEEVGIPIAKYRAWMRNPAFAGAMTAQAEDNLGDSVQMALNRLIANAESGDMRAIEKLLEMTGRWNPQQQEVQNAKTIVLTFMEILQEELAGDVPRLRRIMDRVQAKMTALTITNGIKELQ